MAFVDYYKILGVDKNIPQNDVRAAYRKRAKQFHPDLHPNDPKAKAKFQALNEAYDVISDPDKRAKYDKYGEQWKNAAAYEKANAAVVVADDKMHEDPELLLKAIRRLINHPEERDEISKNLKKFSKDNAAENLANTVISVAKE